MLDLPGVRRDLEVPGVEEEECPLAERLRGSVGRSLDCSQEMRRRRWTRACGHVGEPGLEPGDEEGEGPSGPRGGAGLGTEGRGGGPWRSSCWSRPRARRERMRALEVLSGAGLEPEGGGGDFVLHPDSSVWNSY